MPSAAIAPNGDVLLTSGTQIMRSTDKGRTWGKPVFLAEKVAEHQTYYGNTLFCTSKGRLIIEGLRTLRRSASINRQVIRKGSLFDANP